MKVNAWKNIDIECEVEVTLDDCINEMIDVANSDDGSRRKLSALDGATKVLEKLHPSWFGEHLTDSVRAKLRDRLKMWIAELK